MTSNKAVWLFVAPAIALIVVCGKAEESSNSASLSHAEGQKQAPPAPTPAPVVPERASEDPAAVNGPAEPQTTSPTANPDVLLLARVEKAIRKHHLTKLRKEQLSFEVFADDEPGFRDVEVREKHAPGGPGDPATAPRLFTFRVELATGKLYSDARSDLGDFLPIKD